MEGSGQAILVDPSPVNFIDVPAISDAPKKRLHDPFPAILPASGKESVARTPLTTPLPARSSNTHSLPTRSKVRPSLRPGQQRPWQRPEPQQSPVCGRRHRTKATHKAEEC